MSCPGRNYRKWIHRLCVTFLRRKLHMYYRRSRFSYKGSQLMGTDRHVYRLLIHCHRTAECATWCVGHKCAGCRGQSYKERQTMSVAGQVRGPVGRLVVQETGTNGDDEALVSKSFPNRVPLKAKCFPVGVWWNMRSAFVAMTTFLEAGQIFPADVDEHRSAKERSSG